MTFGRGFFAVCQWLLVMIIVKQGTATDLGEYSYALALTGPIIMFSQLNLRAFMATDSKSEFEFEDYMATRLLAGIFSLLLVAVIVIMKDLSFAFISLIFIVTMFKIFESISDIYYGLLQQKELMAYISFSLIFHGLAALICMQSAMIFNGGVILGAFCIAVSWFLILIVFDKRVAYKTKINLFELDWVNPYRIFCRCLPLGIVMGLISLRIAVPTYFVEANYGVVKVGQYSAILYFLLAGNLIISSLIQAAAPRLAFYYNFEKHKIVRFIIKLLIIAVAIGMVGVLIAISVGDIVLAFFYDTSFEKYNTLLSLIICAGAIGLVAQILGLVLTVARLFKYQVYGNIAGVVFVTLTSYLLIPKYGLEGGAFALIAGNAAVFISNVAFVLMNKVVTIS